jgi:hypothetical protein
MPRRYRNRATPRAWFGPNLTVNRPPNDRNRRRIPVVAARAAQGASPFELPTFTFASCKPGALLGLTTYAWQVA